MSSTATAISVALALLVFSPAPRAATQQPSEPASQAGEQSETSATEERSHLDNLFDDFDTGSGSEAGAAASGEDDDSTHLDDLFENFDIETATEAPATVVDDTVEPEGLWGHFHTAVWPIFDWTDHTALGIGIKNSFWLFPVIEAFHLVAFAILGGTILLIDLRLLGLLFGAQRVDQLARAARPWVVASLAVMLISGVLQFFSEPVKLYYSRAFWIKMGSLLGAVAVTYLIRRKIVAADPERVGPLWGRLVAVLSIALWATVAWGGRWIGFS